MPPIDGRLRATRRNRAVRTFMGDFRLGLSLCCIFDAQSIAHARARPTSGLGRLTVILTSEGAGRTLTRQDLNFDAEIKGKQNV